MCTTGSSGQTSRKAARKKKVPDEAETAWWRALSSLLRNGGLEAGWCLGGDGEEVIGTLIGALGEGRQPKVEASVSQGGVRALSRPLECLLGCMRCDAFSLWYVNGCIRCCVLCVVYVVVRCVVCCNECCRCVILYCVGVMLVCGYGVYCVL